MESRAICGRVINLRLFAERELPRGDSKMRDTSSRVIRGSGLRWDELQLTPEIYSMGDGNEHLLQWTDLGGCIATFLRQFFPEKILSSSKSWRKTR